MGRAMTAADAYIDESKAFIGSRVLLFLSRELLEKFGEEPPWDLVTVEKYARELADKYLVNFKPEQRPKVSLNRENNRLAIHVTWT
jgi:hypothetical protein